MYTAEVESFTHKCINQIVVSKKFLNSDDHILIIDDFLANGCALQGLISVVPQAHATLEGIFPKVPGLVLHKFRKYSIFFHRSSRRYSQRIA